MAIVQWPKMIDQSQVMAVMAVMAIGLHGFNGK
jgi:hypothetical protein